MSSTTTTRTFDNNPIPSLLPNPSSVFTIQAEGISVNGFSSSSQLLTPVYRGTEISTAEAPVYVSERPFAKSNSAILRHNDIDVKSNALVTTYKPGYGAPKLGRLSLQQASGLLGKASKLEYGVGDPVAQVNTHWWTKRAALTLQSGTVLEWKYLHTCVQPSSKRKRVLALVIKNEAGHGQEVLAVLLRTKYTRTPGTSRWGAGNGGQLIISENAERVLGEEVIVATCLMMLKREVDRMVQSNFAAAS